MPPAGVYKEVKRCLGDLIQHLFNMLYTVLHFVSESHGCFMWWKNTDITNDKCYTSGYRMLQLQGD